MAESSKRTLGVRMSLKDCRLLTEASKARGEDISSFIRRSVKKEFAALGYLSADEMKALGVKPQEEYC